MCVCVIVLISIKWHSQFYIAILKIENEKNSMNRSKDRKRAKKQLENRVMCREDLTFFFVLEK